MAASRPPEITPARSPWPVLQSVREFSIQILTHTEHGFQTTLLGSGHLQVEHVDARGGAAVVWREKGRWTSGPLAGIPFHNSSEWRGLPETQAIELSHLRRGDASPTFLVRLEPTASGAWASAEPHACGADYYSAILHCNGEGLRLSWDVRSPSDAYRLVFDARIPSG